MRGDASRHAPERLVVRNDLERDSRILEDWSLREHRLERIHLTCVLERIPHADIRQLTVIPVDADVVGPVESPAGTQAGNAAILACRRAACRERAARVER